MSNASSHARTTSLPVGLCPLAALALIQGCASGPPPAPPKPIEARVSGIFPRATSLTTSLLSVKVQVFNPRSTPVPVEKIRYVLDTKGVAGKLEGMVPTSGAILESEQQAELGFDIEIPLPADDEALVALAQADSLPADLTGEVDFGDGSTTSFTRKTGLAMPSLPKFVVFDAQAAQYEKEGVEVTLLLRLINENGFTQSVLGVTYTVNVAGKEVRQQRAGVGARLPPSGAEEYEVNVTLEPKNFDGLKALLASGIIDYQVTGTLETREVSLPFDHRGKIDLGANE